MSEHYSLQVVVEYEGPASPGQKVVLMFGSSVTTRFLFLQADLATADRSALIGQTVSRDPVLTCDWLQVGLQRGAGPHRRDRDGLLLEHGPVARGDQPGQARTGKLDIHLEISLLPSVLTCPQFPGLAGWLVRPLQCVELCRGVGHTLAVENTQVRGWTTITYRGMDR